ncbi:rho GTPase-activating protein 6-like isoform X2 [Acanthaster planci]|uniref:Rho GTPase-activating protein 6-like isoform X2 n=1 Tax=Acanthaster planci TaxID=133434 RepID=A0A8B7ZIH1_ACAPL|nr:rho GTPase-activating protein 6-like isoform X2 [Acanthaster planci]
MRIRDRMAIAHASMMLLQICNVMHKGRQSSSPSSKFMPKKIWRTKSKPQSSSPTVTTLWNPEGNCRWHSVSGRTVTLTTTALMQLSELERRQLQKVAHQRLQNMHLGPIIVPKDPLTKRPKKGSFLRGRHRNNSVLDSLKDLGKEGKESSTPLVFGIPLEKCIGNEKALRRYHSTRRKERRESLDLAQSPLLARQQGKQVKGSVEDIPSLAQSSSGSTSSTSTSLLDALSLSTSTEVDVQRRERRNSLLPQEPKVPQVVQACFGHLEKRALHILGIFRVGGSKKRTRQLREDFDAGNEIILNDSHNPHDVGALLKEFFRDLPEPLLTRELYPAFVACTRLENFEQRLRALQLLVYLLPTANRDTLNALLGFLNRVSKNAADTVDDDGNEIQGNKMDTHNLATLFGPNILRKTKGGQDRDAHGGQEASEQVEESREVISVVQIMTEHMEAIFQVPAEIQDSVLKITYETDPEALDYLLTKRAVALGCVDPAEMEATFNEDIDSPHSSSPPCTPEEILMPFHALHGHEHRLFSSPDDLYACRNKSDFTDESLGHVTREQMLQQSKQKSLSLPRAAPVIDSRFPSSPKIARTGCEDRSVSGQQERSTKTKRGRHSSENQDESNQWGGESSPTSTITPPTRLVRGISNEKQIFSPLSPHSPRRISGGPVSPLVGHPPERQFSSPANMDSGTLSPNLEISYQSKSPRTVRKHASDLLPSPWKLGDDASDQVWLPVDNRRTQSVSDCIKPTRPCVISPSLQRRGPPKSPQPRIAKVPIAAMEEDFDMDLPLETASTSPTSPERDDKQWQGKWKLKDGQETLV